MSTKEVAKRQEVVEFPALAVPAGELREAIQENLGGGTLSPFDLERVKIPSGGGLHWSVPSLDGEETTDALTGIVVGSQDIRVYYKGEYAGGQDPPDCKSDDAITGQGDPGGLCKDCPFSQWKSGKDGEGQACALKKRVFLLRPGEMLPLVLILPVGSLKKADRTAFPKYMLRLTTNALKGSSVVSKVTLERDKNKKGIVYSKAVWSMVGKLDEKQAAAAKAYAEMLSPSLKQVVSEEDFKEDISYS